ncbi:hypothetical protein NEOLEDRAFT_573125 [Neolentinus lepideus HHB14362 ss-1]|uniref:Coenzyme Q-binding protein COQ10 START domain-containing protein n=1 Tax=Neolentinus lepideus HHB14362 ss-1 TaxID=1314782 RepID=A0A165QWL6_9AGAM|nr:hypothetical protein NEOLEDRAFT_573125 [Neolentinus lepideus HHB14362 ss-1]
MAPPKDTSAPPSPSVGVFSITRTVIIEAPRERIWGILLDFPKYNEWNPFARGQSLVDKSKKPLGDQTPAPGKYLLISFSMPPTLDPSVKPKPAFEYITNVDHANYRVSWRNVDMPAWLLWADRWQSLTEEGDGKVKYETFEVFGGILAYVVKWFMSGHLEEAFEAMGKGLKERAEKVEPAAEQA